MQPQQLAILSQALVFAADRHRNQRRKDHCASPYINHPIALLHILIDEGGVTDVEVLAAAVLHDTIEDTETEPEELSDLFGETICSIVLEVTDDKDLPKLERKRRQIEHAPTLSPQARLVKYADKIANLRDLCAAPPVDWPLERQQAYFDWAKAVIDGLAGSHPPLQQAFDEVYALKPA